MAALSFDDYRVKKMQYWTNDNFDESIRDIKLDIKSKANVEIFEEEQEASVVINIKVGSKKKQNQPFFTEVEMEGSFSYYPEEDEEGIGFENFLKINALAILFPYVRTFISDLTQRSNQFPAYLLPTINFEKVIDGMDGIKIDRFE